MLSKFARSVVLSRSLISSSSSSSSSSSLAFRSLSTFSSSSSSSSSSTSLFSRSSSPFSSSSSSTLSSSLLLHRSFATAPPRRSSPPKEVEPEEPASAETEELSEPASLKEVKTELSRVLDEDASDLAVVPDEDISEYIQDQELRITLEKDSIIKVSKKVENYRIGIEFQYQFDADAEEKGQQHEEALAKHRAESGEAEPEDPSEDYKAPQHSFTIQIRTEKTSTTSMPAYIELSCYADPGGALAVESFSFEDPEVNGPTESPNPVDAASLFRDDAHKLYFDDLNEASQDKVLEWLESIGIDDTFAVFVQQYSQMVRAQKLVDKMKSFKAFLAQ